MTLERPPGTTGMGPYRSEDAHLEDKNMSDQQIEASLQAHGPYNWRSHFPGIDILTRVSGRRGMTVLAVDLRKSTELLANLDPMRFAFRMHQFVNQARIAIRDGGGWFDKFTGDGFLAYWIEDLRETDEYHVFSPVIFDDAIPGILDVFTSFVLPLLEEEANSELPAGFGMGLGLEAGVAVLVEVAGDMTILGMPVVDAVRMVSVAEPGEVLCDEMIGGVLIRSSEEGRYTQDTGIQIDRVLRQPKGQSERPLTRITYDPAIWSFGQLDLPTEESPAKAVS
jgi:class 3 adenylate cyclase